MATTVLSDAARDGEVMQVMDLLNSIHDFTQRELDVALEQTLWGGTGCREIARLLLSHGAHMTVLSFHGAIKLSDIEVFQELLNHGWDVNSVEFEGEPALRLVVSDEACVKWLLEHGADPNKPSTRGLKVLDTAASSSSPAVINLLIDHGAKLEQKALYAATDVFGPGGISNMRCLIEHGIDVNATSRKGSPLIFAAQQGDKARVQLLLDSGAGRGFSNIRGLTAADIVRSMGDIRSEIYEILTA